MLTEVLDAFGQFLYVCCAFILNVYFGLHTVFHIEFVFIYILVFLAVLGPCNLAPLPFFVVFCYFTLRMDRTFTR